MNSNNNKGRSGSNRIPLPTIIAHNSTEQAQRLITTKFGYPRARNVKELELRLAQIIKGFPDGLKLISQIHPDRELILQYNAPKMMEGGMSNGGEFSSATGLPPEIVYVPSWAGTTPTLMTVEDWGDVRVRKMRGGYEEASGGGAGKKAIGTGVVILSSLALGALLVAFGERRRANG